MNKEVSRIFFFIFLSNIWLIWYSYYNYSSFLKWCVYSRLFFFFYYYILYWSVVDLQCFRYTGKWFTYENIYSSEYFTMWQDIKSNSLYSSVCLCWLSILYVQFSLQRVRHNWATFTFTFRFSSVVQLCLTLCDPMDWSTTGFLVHHQLPELAQAHVYWVSNAIQPSHPLSPPYPPALNLSQHQSIF